MPLKRPSLLQPALSAGKSRWPYVSLDLISLRSLLLTHPWRGLPSVPTAQLPANGATRRGRANAASSMESRTVASTACAKSARRESSVGPTSVKINRPRQMGSKVCLSYTPHQVSVSLTVVFTASPAGSDGQWVPPEGANGVVPAATTPGGVHFIPPPPEGYYPYYYPPMGYGPPPPQAHEPHANGEAPSTNGHAAPNPQHAAYYPLHHPYSALPVYPPPPGGYLPFPGAYAPGQQPPVATAAPSATTSSATTGADGVNGGNSTVSGSDESEVASSPELTKKKTSKKKRLHEETTAAEANGSETTSSPKTQKKTKRVVAPPAQSVPQQPPPPITALAEDVTGPSIVDPGDGSPVARSAAPVSNGVQPPVIAAV